MGFPVNLDDYAAKYASKCDVSRENLLRFEWAAKPQPDIPYQFSHDRVPYYRVRPREITEWVDFPQEVQKYWSEQVPTSDKTALVAISSEVPFQLVSDSYSCPLAPYSIPFKWHCDATEGHNGVPLPSDKHSVFRHFSSCMGFVGTPDFIFVSFDDVQAERKANEETEKSQPRTYVESDYQFQLFPQWKERITAVVMGGNPFILTPRELDAVLSGKIPKNEGLG
jgi:hypothetical protein